MLGISYCLEFCPNHNTLTGKPSSNVLVSEVFGSDSVTVFTDRPGDRSQQRESDKRKMRGPKSRSETRVPYSQQRVLYIVIQGKLLGKN